MLDVKIFLFSFNIFYCVKKLFQSFERHFINPFFPSFFFFFKVSSKI